MDPPWRFGVDERYDDATQEPKGDESLLIVAEAIISVGKGRPSEHLVSIDEV